MCQKIRKFCGHHIWKLPWEVSAEIRYAAAPTLNRAVSLEASIPSAGTSGGRRRISSVFPRSASPSPDRLFLKHGSRILRQPSNSVCGFSMKEQERLCAEVSPIRKDVSNVPKFGTFGMFGTFEMSFQSLQNVPNSKKTFQTSQTLGRLKRLFL